ncbi:hypothetical protein RUM43_009899 [Polyplax serrata]|uniref:Uncharacterized protein n=1 Tax=Polyplax serrata TaxID=468196 RepID=A0AAN8PV34_POLSC
MGVKQSKRSVDITETSTKGEIEGFGNEGKVEKIVDGVMEKVAANGHVENDLQIGIGTLMRLRVLLVFLPGEL